MSLNTFFGKKVYKGFLQEIYDLTLSSLRSLTKTWYAPKLKHYDEDEGYGKIRSIFLDSVEHIFISKPGAREDDEFFVNNLKIKEGVAEYESVLSLKTVEDDYALMVKDLSTIFNIGSSKIKRLLRDKVNEIFSNSLINDKFLTILNKVSLSSDGESAAFIITYNFKTINEKDARPEGIDYQTTKRQTKVGKY